MPLLELRSCILHKASYGGLLPAGIEGFWDRKKRKEYPQAWLLRISAPPTQMNPVY